MIKKVFLFIILIIFINTAFSLPNFLYLVTDENFPPFSFREDNIVKGIDVDIVSELFKRLNIKVKIDLVPWKRLLYLTETGLCDGSFSLFKTNEREKFAIYADSIGIHYSSYYIFTKTGKAFNFNKITDLYGKTLALLAGFSISKEFDEAVKNNKIIIEEQSNLTSNIKKLLAGRVDGLVGQYEVTLYTLKKMNLLDKVTKLKKSLKEKRAAYFVISKKSKIKDKEELIKKINAVLKEMDAENIYEKISQKYLK